MRYRSEGGRVIGPEFDYAFDDLSADGVALLLQSAYIAGQLDATRQARKDLESAMERASRIIDNRAMDQLAEDIGLPDNEVDR